MDGNYPLDYVWWFIIITIAGLVIPWCFFSDEYSCDTCGKAIEYKEPYITRIFETGTETKTKRYHEYCLYPKDKK